jgi:hypothetical protein
VNCLTFHDPVDVTEDVIPRERPKCDRQGCAKRIAGYALFVWGAAGLCKKHLAEERVTPRAPKGSK